MAGGGAGVYGAGDGGEGGVIDADGGGSYAELHSQSPVSGTNGRGYQRGVVYYLDDNNRIMGVLLWNATDLVERARELIRRQPLDTSAMDTSVKGLKRKIPLAPDSWLTVQEAPARNKSLRFGTRSLGSPR
mmetsp:Transcript_6996/g.14489  ORF Transcript_6996/g.14489 Transcript_6996/m.14489 type:complete len:131 (+) Transcript_6996:2-394(+)